MKRTRIKTPFRNGSRVLEYGLSLGCDIEMNGATLWFATYMPIGGISSFAGAYSSLSFFAVYSHYISASILLIVVHLMPGGLAGLPQLIRSLYTAPSKGEGVGHAS